MTLNPSLPITTTYAESFAWLSEHQRKRKLSMKDLGKRIGVDDSTVNRIINNRYEGNPENIGRAIQSYRASLRPEFPFVETNLAQNIWSYIELVRLSSQRIGNIIGDSQASKTRNVLEWRRRNPDLDISYLQLPTGGHLGHTIDWFCSLRGISPDGAMSKVKIKLERSVTEETIFILDEIQQIEGRTKSRGRVSATKYETLSFFRRLRDTTGCCLITMATTDLIDAALLIELRRRSLPTFRLDPQPTTGDLNLFAKKLGLAPATSNLEALDFQKTTISKHGLGTWLTYLQAAERLAKVKQRSVTWDDVLVADSIFQKASGK